MGDRADGRIAEALWRPARRRAGLRPPSPRFRSTVEVPPLTSSSRRQRRPALPVLGSGHRPLGAGRFVPAAGVAGATYEAVFGLLATTGMRVGEALRARRRRCRPADGGHRDHRHQVQQAPARPGACVGSCRPSPLRRGAGRAAVPESEGSELLRLHPGDGAALRLRQRGVPRAPR